MRTHTLHNLDPGASLPGASLLDMPNGCRLQVEALRGSPSVRSRLYALGILPGTEMEVCRHGRDQGSVCVRVRRSSLVIGESMAQAIMCRPAGVADSDHGRERHAWTRQGKDALCRDGENEAGPHDRDCARDGREPGGANASPGHPGLWSQCRAE